MKRYKRGERVAILGSRAPNDYFVEGWAHVIYVPEDPQEPYGVRFKGGRLAYRWINQDAQSDPKGLVAMLNKTYADAFPETLDQIRARYPTFDKPGSEIEFRHPNRLINLYLQIRRLLSV